MIRRNGCNVFIEKEAQEYGVCILKVKVVDARFFTVLFSSEVCVDA